MPSDPPSTSSPRQRRPRYAGKYPRQFPEKYKELDPARYPSEVQKVLASGKTPAGSHRPILVPEVLDCLQPTPGAVVVDATLGGGGHAVEILRRIQPGGRLIGLDVDAVELARTEARLRALGFGPEAFVARHSTFAALPAVLAAEGVVHVDAIFADLGVSSMQLDDPARGFSYKGVGPLDMRMNPDRGQPASAFLATIDVQALARILVAHADEPHAEIVARALVEARPVTTHEAEKVVRRALETVRPALAKPEVKTSVRRTFQAIRIAVNDEFSALDALLRALPWAMAAGGRVAIITFHSGEDRRVKQAFRLGLREGTYGDISREVIRASMIETRANRRAASAKLRWAVRAT